MSSPRRVAGSALEGSFWVIFFSERKLWHAERVGLKACVFTGHWSFHTRLVSKQARGNHGSNEKKRGVRRYFLTYFL